LKGPKQQKALLGGLERLIGVLHPSLLPKTSVILMQFYQADLIEEDVLIEWGKKRSKKYVDKETSKAIRKYAQEFLNWLEEAEEDSEEEAE
jgi:translation initiation factor 5